MSVSVPMKFPSEVTPLRSSDAPSQLEVKWTTGVYREDKSIATDNPMVLDVSLVNKKL